MSAVLGIGTGGEQGLGQKIVPSGGTSTGTGGGASPFGGGGVLRRGHLRQHHSVRRHRSDGRCWLYRGGFRKLIRGRLFSDLEHRRSEDGRNNDRASTGPPKPADTLTAR